MIAKHIKTKVMMIDNLKILQQTKEILKI